MRGFYLIYRLIMFVFLSTSIALTSGCVSCPYPDQRTVFLKSPEGKSYELYATSGYELEHLEERSFNRAVIALGIVKKKFSADSNVVQFIDAQIKQMRNYHEDALAEQKAFTESLCRKDRLFRFLYDGEKEFEMGILVLRNGKVVRRLVE